MVPLFIPGGPRSLASEAGNGLCHHGPCRYADVTWPALCTKSDCPKVWAMGPPTMHHHRPPTRGAQDDECRSRLAGPRHQARWSSQSHSISQCSGWWRYRVSHRPARVCRLPLGSS